jgi:hypothetical protein
MRLTTAPGAYSPVTSDFDQLRLRILKQKKMAVRSGWAQNIAFTSTERYDVALCVCLRVVGVVMLRSPDLHSRQCCNEVVPCQLGLVFKLCTTNYASVPLVYTAL